MKVTVEINIPNEKLSYDDSLSLAYDLLEKVKGEIIFLDKDCSEFKGALYHSFNPDAKLRSQEDNCQVGKFKFTMD